MLGQIVASLMAAGVTTAPLLPPPPVWARVVRQQGDLAPCPGINPAIRRPRGSNCLGIVPGQCGADRVHGFVGRVATPATRKAIAVTAGHRRIRWIREGEAPTEELSANRLNVVLDRRGGIAIVDCY